MSLLPFFPGGVTGGETINEANEITLSGFIGNGVDGQWASGSRYQLLTWRSVDGTARLYSYDTPVDYRIGALSSSITVKNFNASVAGDPEFWSFDHQGSNFIAAREAGTGETNSIIEKYNSGGTAQQKLDTGTTDPIDCVRLVDGGDKLFYLIGNVLYERTLSTANDLTSASGATAHTLTEVSTSATNFDFNDTGTRLYVTDLSGVEEYSMTGFNVGSRSNVGNTSTSGLFVGSGTLIAFMQSGEIAVGSPSTLYKLEI